MKDFHGVPRTAIDVFEMLPEGTLFEVFENALYIKPVPTLNHQRVLGDIIATIHRYIKEQDLGSVWTRCDVHLSDGQCIVQPDIYFIKKDRQEVIQSKGIYGVPDLVIEILLSDKQHDQQRKFDLYRENHVPEYVIIDPDTKELWHYVLINDTYQAKTDITPGQLHLAQLDLTLNF